jgi:hypothetical protein
MRLTTRQEACKRVVERLDHEMDFCAQPAFAAPDRLVFAVFLGAGTVLVSSAAIDRMSTCR